MAKSVIAAYGFWLFGGLLGAHHLYLGRDGQWFLWFSSLGGFVIGWVVDAFMLPDYVAQANRTVEYMQGWEQKQGRRVPEMQPARWVLSYAETGLYEIVVSYALMPYLPAIGVALGRGIARAIVVHLCFSSRLKRTRLRWTLIASFCGEAAMYCCQSWTQDISNYKHLLLLQTPYFFTAMTAFRNQKYSVHSATEHPCVRWPLLMICAFTWSALVVSALYHHLEIPVSLNDPQSTEKVKTLVQAYVEQHFASTPNYFAVLAEMRSRWRRILKPL